MSARICLTLIAALVVLVLVQRGLSWSIPGYDILAPSLLMLAALSYVPFLVSCVRDGEISVPPQIVLRHSKPVLFWIIVAYQTMFALAVIVGATIKLLELFN